MNRTLGEIKCQNVNDGDDVVVDVVVVFSIRNEVRHNNTTTTTSLLINRSLDTIKGVDSYRQ